MKNNLKRIWAIVGVALILLWIIATFLIAIIPATRETNLFPIFIAGCVIFPIMLWIIIWMVGALTQKKNIASFRSEEMEETMKLADEIRYANKAQAENSSKPSIPDHEENSVKMDLSADEPTSGEEVSETDTNVTK